jgi:hypothetical protein
LIDYLGKTVCAALRYGGLVGPGSRSADVGSQPQAVGGELAPRPAFFGSRTGSPVLERLGVERRSGTAQRSGACGRQFPHISVDEARDLAAGEVARRDRAGLVGGGGSYEVISNSTAYP